MFPVIRHSAGNGRVAADRVAASSNHSEGRADPAALITIVSRATHTGSQGLRRRTATGVGAAATAGSRRSVSRAVTATR